MDIRDIICFRSVAFVVFIMILLIDVVCCLANKGYDDGEYWNEYWHQEKINNKENNMSEQNRTPEEYIERYAKQYTDDDLEEAAGHAMVKEVILTLKEE